MLAFRKNLLIQLIFVIIISFLVETYVLFVEQSKLISEFSVTSFFNYFSFKQFIVFLVIFSIITYILSNEQLKNKSLAFIYKYRFLLSLLAIVVCVVFQIHGSSINELNFFNIKHNFILGVSRSIRADEFNVNTMLAFSQYCNNFSYFSDIVRATPTDMFLIYGQPVWDIGIIFKPFLWGYLFLNQGEGLSFFWISRLLALLLVSFEFGKLITNKNKILALSYSLLITFSPLVQWWFAINGLVEQLIFGQLIVLLIDFYMNTDDYRKRLLSFLLMSFALGGFILVMYPSWQIPFAYVFVLLAIWIFLKNKPNFTFNKNDLLIIIISVSLVSILLVHILHNSMDTLRILMNTIYPGNEIFNGMGDLTYFFNYIPSIFFSIIPDGIPLNPVDASAFCDFFPIPIILSCIVIFYQKTKDKLLYGLLALYFIFIVFYIVQFPDFIVDVTFRGHVRNIRLFTVIGFIGCLILIRSMSSLKKMENKKLFILVSILLSIVVVYLSRFGYGDYYHKWMLIILVIFYSIFFSIIFLSSSRKGKKAFLIACIALSFLTGALVNPVDSGVDVVYDSPYIQEVGKIVGADPEGNWIVQDMYLNSLLPVGAKTINSINTYPDLDKWHDLDPNNEYVDVYNRYAHICIIVQNDTNTSFGLVSQDTVHVYLNVNDLEKLNVSYIATPNELDDLSNENVTLTKIYEEPGAYIYHVTYS